MKQLNENAIIIGLEKINLDDFPNLKVLGCNCTGLDHIDLEECKRRGIKVISLRDFPFFMKTITSTSEHCFGLILALMRNYRTALNPPYKDREEYKGHTLSDKVLGIIGYGRVGKQLKKMAVGFSMTIITHDKGESYLDNLLEESDVVSLNVNLEGNENFFTRDMFQKMKPTSYLVNTSRSGVIQEGALLWALESGTIKGAGVDFIDDPQLLEYAKTHNNLILCNHLGGNTVEDRTRTEDFIKNLVTQYINENNV